MSRSARAGHRRALGQPRSTASAAQISWRARSTGIARILDQRRACRSRRSARAARSATRPGSQAVELPARDALVDHLGEPLAHALVELARRSAAAPGGARRAATAPPTAASRRAARPVERQALLDHRRAGARPRAPRRSGHADARVAGALVGVLERLRQQRLARLEVVVDQRRETPASIAIRAIRTSSMPSRAMRRTAASRIRSRALVVTAQPTSKQEMRFRMTTTPVPAADGLSAQEAELQARARAFVDEVLIPLRGAGRARAGRCRPTTSPRSGASRSSARLSGGLHSRRARRPGLDARRVVPRRGAVRPLDQRDLVARPDGLQRARARLARADRALPEARRCAARLHDAYAVTEEHAGSDPSGIRTTAERDRRRLADQRREVVRHLRRRRGRLHRDGQRAGRRRVAADAVPDRSRRARASTVVDDPPFTHNYPHGHPTIALRRARSARTR